MTTSTRASSKAVEGPEAVLAELVEEFTNRLQAGEAPDPEAFAAAHPAHADRLRQLLPALHVLAALSGPAGSERSPMTEGGLEAGPATLGDFRLLREVGRGGMGVVYEAEQLSLGRRVALKVLPFAATMDPRHLQRFHNEARAAACLHHTNIVPVFGVGREQGVHFYAMQLIEGQTLAAVIAELRRGQGKKALPPEDAATSPHVPGAAAASTVARAGLTTAGAIRSAEFFRAVARLGVQAAEALDYAHQMGVVHRDIKPGNLMVDGRGDVWVTDFGLAQLQQGEASLTLTGDLIGTLRYMSPEQALAKRVPIDHRTDVYSLGATVYELLTLRPVFCGDDRQELLRQIAFEEPIRPRKLNRSIPAELETIVLKALEKRPQDRYATAQELADDLRRWLEDRPIQARRPSLVVRARKWARRHKAAVWAAAAVLLVTVMVVGGAGLWQLQQRFAAGRQAEVALDDSYRLQKEGKCREALVSIRRAESLWKGRLLSAALERRVRRRQTDLEMIARLEEIRLRESAAVKDQLFFDKRGSDHAYHKAFQEYGIDVLGLDRGEAAEHIRATGIAAELAAALQLWASACRSTRPRGDDRWKALLEIARAADPDRWRNTLRDALERKDRQALTELASAEEASKLPPATVVQLGDALKATGAHDEAVALLRKARRQHPTDFWINHQLASTLSEMQPPQLEEAIRYYTAAVALRADSPGLHLNLARAFVRNGDWDAGGAAAKEAIRLYPGYGMAHNLLGLALAEKGKVKEAIAEYELAIRLMPDFADAYSNLGVALARRGKLGKALDAHHKAIRIHPDDSELHGNLGNTLKLQGKLDKAIAAYKKAIRLQRNNALAHCMLSSALFEKGEYDKALAAARKAIRIDPTLPFAYRNLGHALVVKDEWDEAIDAFQGCIRFSKREKEWSDHNNLGTCLRSKGRLNEAALAFREAIGLNPKEAMPHYNLGVVLKALHRPDKAAVEFREALRIDKDYADAHRALGGLLLDAGRPAEAIAEFREVLRGKKATVDDRVNLGAALHEEAERQRQAARGSFLTAHLAFFRSRLGFAEAIAEFCAAIRIDKKHAVAHLKLGLSLAARGETDEAITEWRKALRLAPKNAELHFNLGVALEKKGLTDKAIAEYRAAIHINREYAKAHLHLGNALMRQTKLAEAFTQFERALRRNKGPAKGYRSLLRELSLVAEAAAAYREALRSGGDRAEIRVQLGNALMALGRIDDAIAEFQKSLLLKDDPQTRLGLGKVFQLLGRGPEAIVEFRKAIELDKDCAEGHYRLALALHERHQLGKAIDEYREALRLQKNNPDVNYNYARALRENLRPEEAIAAYRTTIRLKEDYAEAHCNLARLLLEKGHFREAAKEYRRGHELGSRRPKWRYPSEGWLREAELVAALDAKLPDFLQGKFQPKDNNERIKLADVCAVRKRYVAAARLHTDLLADTRLPDNVREVVRYVGACCAIQADTGRGVDGAKLDAAGRARWRKQALAWLRADLAASRRVLEKSPDKVVPAVQRRLRHWQQDPDLAGVRGHKALDRLPEAERELWRKLWADVASTLARAGGKRPAEKKSDGK
jgi:tetratricopeptide (TPR) repeat protein